MIKSKDNLGAPENRIEGFLKVTGKAKYAAEFSVPNVLYGFPVRSTIAAGTMTDIDTAEAEKAEGVVKVFTHKNAMKFNPAPDVESTNKMTMPKSVLNTTAINSFGQYIGFVVAETFEQARYAANLVKATYQETDPKIDFDKYVDTAYKPDNANGAATDTQRGSMEEGMSNASKTLDITYQTPIEVHNPMEPHATIAVFEGDALTVYDATQMLGPSKVAISNTFNIPQEKIRVLAPYIGGGFGSKLRAWDHVMLTIMAAKMLDKPVKTAITRQMMQTNAGLRQLNRQHMRIGTSTDGKLTAMSHEVMTHTAVDEVFVEQAGFITRTMYDTPNQLVTHRVFDTNIQVPTWMRAPGETPGSFALECTMDEMADQLQMDPIAFRIKNEPKTNPLDGKPFSSRSLVQCMQVGADKFGWSKRKQEPRQNTKDNWLVGYGMAAASRAAPYQESSSRVKLSYGDDGLEAVIEMAATDIGTGTYTIIAQTAANCLDIPVDRVAVNIGDSDLPATPGSGGSWGAGSFTSAVDAVCEKAKSALKNKITSDSSALTTADELMKAAKLTEFEMEATEGPSEDSKKYAHFSYGAHFVEVWVDEDLGMVKIPRVLSTSAVGTVLNQKTARSQVVGGIVWGIGQAMTEETTLDKRYGSYVTRTFADYHVPVNLDVGDIEVHFIPEEDEHINRMGVKGIGELGITSVAAAIANAIYNATGKRMRTLPITPAKLVDYEKQPVA
ncbi:MAG TPA: xanthine dehydrogenase family protein molybdopterin-binding subunit [Leeuwenhoekiella sp.]|nr:xanthine dehydrogenase family protein molybdopterin-binding subunit [Leeuwenhoekiella sp.]